MSISSMTAFACFRGYDSAAPSYDWTWEVRSVNAKGLDVRLRLPLGFEGLESVARGMVGRCCRRGAVSLTLIVTRTGNQDMMSLNEEWLTKLVAITSEWYQRYPNFLVHPPRLDGLLALPGVLTPLEENKSRAKLKERETLVLLSLEKALDSLAIMRVEEGGRLAAILETHLDTIETLTERAYGSADMQQKGIYSRLHGLMDALLHTSPSLSEERLTQEVALLAAKADVREELDRLRIHIAAARQLIAAGGVVGRKLDFLCQELNREADTLCTKANSIDLTYRGLDLKTTIDQLREQAKNIE
ncbi:Protein YicC [invertebrate metagenome]|uniref:Protein YicC n=1 Tax=invertebrate metagenome TaxID=1711999 RepID=A0A484H622_9ZZZZ